MKRLFLAAIIAVCGTSFVSAQEFRYGPKAGYSLSMMTVESEGEKITLDPKSSFYAGGFAEYKFSDRVGVFAEVLYSQLGGKKEETFSTTVGGITVSGGANIEYDFGTVQIPVGAKYFATENFALALGLNVGIITTAEGKYNVSGTVAGNGQSNTANNSDSMDIKDDINTLNLAPFLGVEYTLENGLFFDARYNYGVSNLSKDSDVTVKNSFAQIGIGFKFGNY